MRTFIFRLLISEQAVLVETFDPVGAPLINPHGALQWDAARRAQVLDLASRALPGENRLAPAELELLGGLLFKTLFEDSLAARLVDFFKQYIQPEPDVLLRIELQFLLAGQPAAGALAAPPSASLAELAALPWEFMLLPVDSGVGPLRLCSDARLALVRLVGLDQAPRSLNLKPGEKLRIGLAVAAPDFWLEQDLGPVAYQDVDQALKALEAAFPQKISYLPMARPATPDAICALLEQKPHLFHFIGHGELNPAEPSGTLYLVDTPGSEIRYNGVQFAGLFDVHQPGVVVMQSCESAAALPDTPYSGAAARLAAAGVPAVVAMQYKISNLAAGEFARKFYEFLARGVPVDRAVQAARDTLTRFSGSLTRSYATPALFLRTRSASFFTRQVSPLAESLYALPGLAEARQNLVDAYLDALRTRPQLTPDPEADTLQTILLDLDQVVAAPGQPSLLAVFALALAKALPLAQKPLADDLQAWLARNAQLLGYNPAGQAAPVPPAADEPLCLQLILLSNPDNPNRGKDRLYSLVARDARQQITIFQSPKAAGLDLLSAEIKESISRFAQGLKLEDKKRLASLRIEVFLDASELSLPIEKLNLRGFKSIVLGQAHQVVVRSQERWKFFDEVAIDWTAKWESVQTALKDATRPAPYQVLDSDSASSDAVEQVSKQVACLGFAFEPRNTGQAELLMSFLASGVPVAAWVRQGADPKAALACLNELFTPANLKDLPELVRQRRCELTDAGLGQSLVLLWDDPERSPGDLAQFQADRV